MKLAQPQSTSLSRTLRSDVDYATSGLDDIFAAAVDEAVREADVGGGHRPAPVATPVNRGNRDVARTFTRRTSSVISSAVASARSRRRCTPGRVSVAAQSAGMPLVSAPREKTTTRPPSRRATIAGCRASARWVDVYRNELPVSCPESAGLGPGVERRSARSRAAQDRADEQTRG
jgi:hypothetical protein